MWIKVVKNDLDGMLKNIVRAVSTRTTLPVLTGIYIKSKGQKVILRGTDLEITVETLCPAKVEDEGEVVIPARAFSELVKNLEDGQIEIKTDSSGTEVEIIGKNSLYKLRTFPSEEFPQGKGVPEGKKVVISGGEFREALKKVVKAASRDETRLSLTGVYMESGKNSLTLAATDSYRLAVVNLRCNECSDGIVSLIPSRALDELSKMIEDDILELIISESQLVVSQNNWTFFSRLIDGQFPAFKQLFPDESFIDLIVSTEDFNKALKRASVVLQNNPVKIEVSEKEVHIKGINSDLGEAEELIEGESSGSIEIAFNYTYLIEGVQNITSDKIKIEIQEGLKPAVIRPLGEEDFSYLLMPVRSS